MNLENGTIINQYKILSAIGKGGMGEVFLAQDTKLNRKVALKILPPEFAEDLDRMSRFVREAQSASALNHPNIITIYEIGESGGTHFIATEFIDGKTLSDYAKASPLDYKSALEIAIQVASALDEAHSAGIVHRDIKPDNIMVRANGLAKILDFGIAKLTENETPEIESEDATAIQSGTSPGMVIGTANYMSPEQAKGQTVDARTDIFSFGVVLYEMLANDLPFAGETAMETIGAIIHKEPKPLNSAVPPEIAGIINKTLRKDRNERYQTIRDVLNDLKDTKQNLELQNLMERTISPDKEEPKTQIIKAATVDESNQTPTGENRNDSITIKKAGLGKAAIGIFAVLLIAAIGLGYWFYSGSNPKQIESIAVLPFENKSSDADTEYLSDGLAESLIYRLSQLPNLKVSPTSSVFRYKGKATDPQIVARELGVDSVLMGRIVQRGDNLNISVNLVDTRNGKSLWGEKYERKMSELLATQTQIINEITNKLQLKLSGENEQKLTKRYTDNNEAYQLYLKGQFHFAKRSEEDMLKAVGYFERAIKLDQNFVLAYVGIADTYSQMPWYGYMQPDDAMSKAKRAVEKALAIDPSLAEAHATLAIVLAAHEWNWAESEREFKRALELNSNIAKIHLEYAGIYLIQNGRFDEAIASLNRALELEPLSMPTNGELTFAMLNSGQYAEGLKQAQKAYDLEPNHPASIYYLGLAYCINKNYTEAINLGEKVLAKDPNNQDALFITGYAYAKSGKKSEAEGVLTKFKVIGKTQYVASYYVATINVGLGKKDAAIEELEKAFVLRDPFVTTIKVDPLMNPLRDDPRFNEMVRRLNLPE